MTVLEIAVRVASCTWHYFYECCCRFFIDSLSFQMSYCERVSTQFLYTWDFLFILIDFFLKNFFFNFWKMPYKRFLKLVWILDSCPLHIMSVFCFWQVTFEYLLSQFWNFLIDTWILVVSGLCRASWMNNLERAKIFLIKLFKVFFFHKWMGLNSLFIFINSKELKRCISGIAVTSSRGILWASSGSHIFLIIHVRLCALRIMPYSSYCNAIEFSSISKSRYKRWNCDVE